ncbi:MAG TPA: hypothetical protein VI007_04920 [bacterium]
MTRAQLYALIVTAGILVLFAGGGGRRFVGGPGGVVTERHEGMLGGAQLLRAHISQGAGTLRIQTADTETAYLAALTHDRRDRIDVMYRSGELRIAEAGRRIPGRMTNEWDITLSRRIPVNLRISTGAGRASVDLSGLRGEIDVRAGAGEVLVSFGEGDAAVEELGMHAGAGRFVATGLGFARARKIEARAGVGELQLDFSGPGRDLTEVEISGGVGRIIVTVPQDAGVRVRGRGSVTGRLTLPWFTQRGDDEHVNASWETAPVRIDIQARLGVGGLEVLGR